jgi:hypothetical protein
LLRRLIPHGSRPNARHPHRLVSWVLIVLSLLLPVITIGQVLVVVGCLIVLGVVWLVINGLRQSHTVNRVVAFARRWPWLFVALVALIALVIVAPIQGTKSLQVSDIASLMIQLDSLFLYFLGLALILIMREDVRRQRGRSVLGVEVIEIGALFFAIFLINSSTSWLFIPVPFLVGLFIARFWLLQWPSSLKSGEWEDALIQSAEDRKELIQDILDASSAKTQFANYQKTLDEKLATDEITPDVRDQKLKDFSNHYEEMLELKEIKPGYKSPDTVFAIGESSVWDNTRIFLRYGALLAVFPVLIALYEYLPTTQASFPYPIATLIVFLIQSTVSWMLYAFFFGYFYVHLNGNSGLIKGLYLCGAIVLTFAVYPLLNAQSLEQLQPFLLWTAQVFLFCTLLGLLAADYRLLRQNGFRTRHLLVVHNLPALSVYASTVVAAVAPTVLALVTGRLNDLVTFFLNTVLPKVPK